MTILDPILYSVKATPSGSNLSLISSKHIYVCKNGEQVVVGKGIGTSKMLMFCPG